MCVSHHPCRFVAPRMKNIQVALMSWIWLNCTDGWKAFEGVFTSSMLTFPACGVETTARELFVCTCRSLLDSRTRGIFFFSCFFAVFGRPTTATQVQGLCRNKSELEGVDSSFYLPISPWILLHYWQTDSRALWVDRSPLSAGYHFQLNPFI